MGCSNTNSAEIKEENRKPVAQNKEEKQPNKVGHSKFILKDSTLGVSKGALIGTFNQKIEEVYKFMKEIGEGAYGKVFIVEHRKTGEKFACKRIAKKKIRNRDTVDTEICLMKTLDHPNIVNLYEIIDDD